MCKGFCHLHNHTEYSLLDGANRIPDMVKRAKDLGQEALAITDHGAMFGVMEFYFECKKQGIKPIIGMEAYVAPGGLLKKDGREENQTYHLLLLAKNLEGYRNLCKLHTVAALQGFYYKPRIDHDLLREHARGLIGTTTCLGSEVNQLLMRGQYDEAQRRAGMYKEIFDEGSYFVEIQDHNLREQHEIKDDLLRIAKELHLPVIATNDSHYLCKESHKAHDVLLCIGTGALLSEDKRLRFETEEFYLKTTEEMTQLFGDIGGAIENTSMVAEMCDLELGASRAPMPKPEVPDGLDTKTYLHELAEKGLKERIQNLDDAAHERLRYELGVIETTGFQDYFLLVREFANYARSQGIAYGVRGSAAGSLVSYCIGITDVDPLEYDLTFERFLNPERISMPDIDMDFEDERRDEVIKYVVERFGQEQVAQIITFGTLGAKAAVKDAGRVMGYLPQETDRICKTIPGVPGMTLDKAAKESGEFRQMLHDPKVSKLVEVAKEIEGTSRHAGVHAAGVVISGEPLTDYVPLYRGNEGQSVTAFEMGILEKIGLLKMDFLGLSNLTVLSKAVQNIERSTGEKLDWQKFPLDDKKTFDMLSKGDTVGVFQLESGGMRRNIIELKPSSVRELAAMVALYRPGPMDHIPTFVDGKFQRRQITYLDERMRPILEETYGVIVYQDQVLKLVQALAGFTLGKADILRRAMGKKDAKAMDDMKVEFLAGTQANGISEAAANKVWELLLPFAGYAFNKAHAVCYALIAYQTAYLKANYPTEYMAALLAVYRDKEDRVAACIEECRKLQIPVLSPDVNRSLADFSIELVRETAKSKESIQAIRFGMAAIKGVGEGIVREIIAERAEAPFTHLYEFCERLKPKGLNRTAVEALIKAGALDSIDRNRATLLEFVDGALAFADMMSKSRLAGQDSLFGGGGEDPAESEYPTLPAKEALDRSTILSFEKEVMGIYVSDHPLKGMERAIQAAQSHPCSQVAELEDGTRVVLAGVIAGLRTIITKSKGEKMASLVLEDFTGQAAATVFPATYQKLQDLIQKDRVVTIKGVVSHRERPGAGSEKTIEIRVEDVGELEAPKASSPVLVAGEDSLLGMITIQVQKATKSQLDELKMLLMETSGDYGVAIQFGSLDEPLPLRRTAPASQEFYDEVNRILRGACHVQQSKLQRSSLDYVSEGEISVA